MPTCYAEPKIVLAHPLAKLPTRETQWAAGYDLSTIETRLLLPMQRVKFRTGLRIALPVGFEGQIRSRSGLSFKKGLLVANGVSTIDADYRGEITIPIINLSLIPRLIRAGDRIAQFVVARHATLSFVRAIDLPVTGRNTGGYGHTGR